jgi:hypothetical protein
MSMMRWNNSTVLGLRRRFGSIIFEQKATKRTKKKQVATAKR